MSHISGPSQSKLYLNIQVFDSTLQFLLDTGSAVSIVDSAMFVRYFASKATVVPPPVKLVNFSQQPITILGAFEAPVMFRERAATVLFYIADRGTSLLGMDAVVALDIQISGATRSCFHTDTEGSGDPPREENERLTPAPQDEASSALRNEWSSRVQNQLASASPPPQAAASVVPEPAKPNLPPSMSNFEHLFSPGLGRVKDIVHKVNIRPSVIPVRHRMRRIPLAARQSVSEEIRRLEAAGVIERINSSEWVSPIVVVQKKDGSIRMCVDLREANKAVVIDSFPLPHIEELLHALHGAKHFSKLDLAAAYHQVPLHKDSRDLTAFITHEGLFRFKRACFGLASAPAAFQQMMSEMLHDCEGVLVYLDHVVVFGRTKEEHTHRLREVLRRISDAGLKLNKCLFDVPEFSFLGHKVSAQGIAPLQTKVDALNAAPIPTDITQLRSFLGMVEYYSRFVPRLASEVEPLRRFLRKDTPFVWDNEADRSFNQVKRLLSSARTLRMFDPTLPTIVATDASAYGIGAVLQQRHGDGVFPVAFASRTLTSTERRYSVGEKEALACLWACEKWHIYLWGRHFTLRTDHQALVSLLSTGGAGRRPLRITRWSHRLLKYNFTVEFQRGAENQVADALSRLPMSQEEEGMEFDDEIISFVALDEECITKQQLQEETANDALLTTVMGYVTSKWPPVGALSADAAIFYDLKDALSVNDGLLLRGEQFVIPTTMRCALVARAHEGHNGIVKTQARLRELYWWPRMNAEVRSAVCACKICNTSDKSAKTSPTPLQPVPLPERPWSKVGIDVVGPFERAEPACRYAITLVDYFSKWPEVQFCPNVTTRRITDFLRAIFAREGYPDSVVSDNGPQFISGEFETFLKVRGIKHQLVSVYYPQSNGQVERFNRTLKGFLQCATLERSSIRSSLVDYLMIYRCTPHARTGLSPALLLHGRKPRTRLNILGLSSAQFLQNPIEELQRLRHRVQQRQQYTKEYTDRRRAAKTPRFRVGDWVRVKKPGKVAKGESAFGPPLRIMKRVGRWTFRLGDGRVWNASKLAAASDPSLGSDQQGTLAAVQGGQPASHTATPGDAHHRHHTWQPQESSSAMQQLPRSRTPECRPAPDTPPGMGTSTAQCPRQVLLRRSGRNRRPPVRYGDLGTR